LPQYLATLMSLQFLGVAKAMNLTFPIAHEPNIIVQYSSTVVADTLSSPPSFLDDRWQFLLISVNIFDQIFCANRAWAAASLTILDRASLPQSFDGIINKPFLNPEILT